MLDYLLQCFEAKKINFKRCTFLQGVSVVFLLFFSHVTCAPSTFLTKRFVDYNYTTEGFLDSSTIQVIAEEEFQSSRGTIKKDKELCIELAQRKAIKRMLRLFLHINKKIIPNKKTSSNTSFEEDYPKTFTEEEYMFAELRFNHYLKEVKIILEDTRKQGKCLIVARISKDKIAEKLREVKLQ